MPRPIFKIFHRIPEQNLFANREQQHWRGLLLWCSPFGTVNGQWRW
jgi:hypothetical protein